MITAVMIDSREPDYIQKANFGVPSMVVFLETADIQAATDDGSIIYIERKTPDDFLNTLKEDRLFPQMARMTAERNAEIERGEKPIHFAYLVITDQFGVERGTGKVITDRGVTGWSYSAVQGALLSIQKMGVFVVFCNGQADYADCVIRIGKSENTGEHKLIAPRPAKLLGAAADFIAGLPSIGIERVQEILEWAGDSPAVALVGITDDTLTAPIGKAARAKIKAMLGLEENQYLEIMQKGETK